MAVRRCRGFLCNAVAVVVAIVTLATIAPSVVVAQSTAECCSTCIGKVADSPYDYDPTSYDQCKLSPEGARVCCFDCGTWGEPEYGDSVTYGSDGTTATVKAGTWISMKWTTATKVTYVTLKDGQRKTVTPTLNGTEATVSSGYYMICAKSKGTIVFRGWGSDSCRQASPEKNITILEGAAGATCEASAPTAPTTTAVTSSSGSGANDLSSCNLNRATIKEVDGKKQCVCVSDWAGAPACDQMPAWKWIITIGGGVAALFSIVISVRAFMSSQKKKKQREEDELATPRVGSKEDVEILRIGADRMSSPPKQTNYKKSDDIYKMNDREFSL